MLQDHKTMRAHQLETHAHKRGESLEERLKLSCPESKVEGAGDGDNNGSPASTAPTTGT